MKSRKKAKKLESKNTPNKLILDGDYAGAILLLKKMLKESPQNHWCLIQMAVAFHESRNYNKALRWIKKALIVSPEDCLLFWWHYAVILLANKQTKEAESVFKDIVFGNTEWLKADCCESKKHSQAIINDCRFCLAKISEDKGNQLEAVNFYKIFVKKANSLCVFKKQEALRKIQSLS